MTPLHIGFFGLPLAALLLQRDGHDIRWAVLPPIPAPGRRRLRSKLRRGTLIDLLDDDSGFGPHLESRLGASALDLVVSWFYTRRIPERWIGRARLGGIGVHPSLLPRHRGPDPYFWAIDSGDTEAGVTVHRLAAEYDTGDILLQRRLPIGARDAWQLARALDRPSLAALREVVSTFASRGSCAATTQEERYATLAPEPSGALLRVDWRWPTERVLRRIRALSPVPGLALEVRGVEFFVQRAREARRFLAALLPGEAAVEDRLIMRTGDGAIAVEQAQLAEAEAPDERAGGATEVSSVSISGAELARMLAARR